MYIEFIADAIIDAPGFDVDWTAATGGTGPLTAGFTTSNMTPIYQEAVTLTDTSTNQPTFWNWDFGDGTSSSVQNPVHTFVGFGTFTVQLIATNCTDSDTTTQVITVGPPPYFSIS